MVGWIGTPAPGGRKGWRGEGHFSSAECDPAVAHVASARVNWPEPPCRAASEAGGVLWWVVSHSPKLLLAEKREEGFLGLGLTLEQLLRLGIRGHYQPQVPLPQALTSFLASKNLPYFHANSAVSLKGMFKNYIHHFQLFCIFGHLIQIQF